MTTILEILSWICLVGGGFFMFVGGLGMLRFPDLFTRLHAASVTETMGAWLILLGLMLQAGLSMVSIKLVLIFLFMFFTSPTPAHALAKAALHAGLKPVVSQDQDKGEKSSKS